MLCVQVVCVVFCVVVFVGVCFLVSIDFVRSCVRGCSCGISARQCGHA
jgi:hypothetical protein